MIDRLNESATLAGAALALAPGGSDAAAGDGEPDRPTNDGDRLGVTVLSALAEGVAAAVIESERPLSCDLVAVVVALASTD